MAEQDRYQLQGSAPQIYEEYKVPVVFRPLAELTLQYVEVREGARVIDVACGTGIIGGLVAGKVGKSGKVVGVDLNPGMVDVAQRCSPATVAKVEWYQGDVKALPFPDASFDLAFCQQGLQFFPEKLAALEEVGRVLAPGGSIILTVWSSVSPLVTDLADALRRYVSDGAAQSTLAPNEFSDSKVIKALLAEARFQAIRGEILRFDRNIGPAQESIPKEMAGSPYWDAVMKSLQL